VRHGIGPRREGGRVEVKVAARDGRIEIEVSDDGPGIALASLPDGRGLQMLRDRLERMGGTLSIGPGAKVCVLVPRSRA